MIEKHFKKIIVFLTLFIIGYILHITRYETLEGAEKSADYDLVEGKNGKTEWVFKEWQYNSKSPLRNGYFVRDRWTNEIKWKDLK